MLMSECDVTEGRCQLLYSAPEALLLRDHWKQLLLSPLCVQVVSWIVTCLYFFFIMSQL